MNVRTTNEIFSYNGGVALVNEVLSKTSFEEKLSKLGITPTKSKKIYGVIVTMLLTCITGSLCYEHIKQFRNDEIFKNLFGIDVVMSAETIRQTMDKLAADEELHEKIVSIIYEVIDELLKMFVAGEVRINKQGVNDDKITSSLNSRYILVDVDVTVLDNSNTKKEKVGCTYKLLEGFAPLQIYIGNGFYLYGELRPGKQHCQNGTVESLKTIISRLKSLDMGEYLVRMDSGNDSNENYALFLEEGIDFIVKWNPRHLKPIDLWDRCAFATNKQVVYYKDLPMVEILVSKTIDINGTNKKAKRVYIAKKKTLDALSSNKRFSKNIDQAFFDVENFYEIEAYTTSLLDVPEEVIREMYHEHGTSEQYHAELKSELNVERLPSKKFATNNLLYTLSILAYDILRIISQVSLMEHDSPMVKNNVSRRRIGSVIKGYIKTVAKLVKHSHNKVMLISSHNPWTNSFLRILEYLEKLPPVRVKC